MEVGGEIDKRVVGGESREGGGSDTDWAGFEGTEVRGCENVEISATDDACGGEEVGIGATDAYARERAVTGVRVVTAAFTASCGVAKTAAAALRADERVGRLAGGLSTEPALIDESEPCDIAAPEGASSKSIEHPEHLEFKGTAQSEQQKAVQR
ncbi:hypothetical protein HDU93_005247 [Gonapodya sp. JEL0774]|nr:hypothetical protein HDU93_005247 [Gonapodya sp. JEL0774]